MTRMLILLAVPLTAGPLHAQVNIERFRRDVRRTGWFASSSVDLSVRTGNVDLVLIGLGTRFDYVGANTRTMLVASGDVGWEHGERFSNRGLLHVRQAFATQGRLAAETFAQIDYDRSRALAFRALVGAGPRVELVRRRTARLSGGTALMLEHERLDLSTTARHPRRTTHQRWSSYLAANLGSGEPLRFAVTTYVQPRLDDFGDTRVLLDGGVAARAGGPASLTLSFALRYDSRPPDATRALDTTVRSGITVEW